jgi:hypothetical protein
MEEIKKSGRGGKRIGAGRKKNDIETTTVSFLMDKELCELLKKDSSIKNRGKFLNNAVRFVLRERKAFDEFLKSVE